MEHLLSPSLLSADFCCLGNEIEMINRSAADWFHVDVMDGVFVPNISFGFPVMEVLKRYARKPLDVHLMITHPERYVERFADAGAWSVSFHLEAVEDPRPILEQIRQKGCKTGLAINPNIAVERLFPYLEEVDMVLLMSVYAGYGGQKFIEETWERLYVLKQEIDQRERKPLIEVDGGVNTENSSRLFEEGVNVLVAGSSVFKAPNPETAIMELKGIL